MRARDILEIDYFILLPVIILVIIGVLFIYSSGITSTGEMVSTEYIKQIVWASIGLTAALVLSMVNYRRFYKISLYLFLATLVPLLYTLLFGRMAYGTRWLRIGSFGLQASEFAKITTIIFWRATLPIPG